MAFAIEGFAAIAQNYISMGIASNFYPKLPLMSAFGAFTLTRNKRDSLNIGRKDAGEILTGKLVSPAERMDLPNINAYQPRIQRFETSNSKWMGKYDTTPTVSSATTAAHSQAMQASALFYRCNLMTPILIWHRDKERAAQRESKEGQGLSMSKLIDEATEVGFQEHVKEINSKIWSGNPSNQAADPWDAPLGVTQALSATNTYGNVDRSVSANSAWRAQVDSTITAVDIEKIVDDANVTKGLNEVGNGADLVITTKALYLLFKAQIISKGSTTCRVLPDGIPGMAQMGVKQEVLQKDNVYIMYDASCPANTVIVLTMDTWKFMIFPGKNLTISDFVDLSKYAEGAKKADQAFIETELIFSCDNPFLNVKYTAIGT